MQKNDKWNIILLGFDSGEARSKVGCYLLSISRDKNPEKLEGLLNSLPQKLFTSIDEENAQKILLKMKSLGATIRIEEAMPVVSPKRENTRCASEGETPVDIPIVKPQNPPPSFSLKRTAYLVLLLFVLSAAILVLVRPHGKIDIRRPEIQAVQDNKDKETIDEVDVALLPADLAARQPEPEEILDKGLSDLNREGIELLKAKRFDEAAGKFGEALSVAPGNEIIKKNLAGAYLGDAWKKYQEGDFKGALKAFDQSLEYESTASAWQGRGMTYVKLGNNDAALSDLESSLVIKDDESIHIIAGTVLYQDNRLSDAREHFKGALALNPLNAVALGSLEKIKREMVEEGFRDKESFHFLVKYEGAGIGDVGHLISAILEEAYHKVGSDLGYYPEDRVTAILYTDKQFRDVTRSPSWAGGIYDGKIRLPAGGLTRRTDDLVRVVYHEYTHALVHRITGGNCPTWLNEGIAQYEEGEAAVKRAETVIRRRGRLVPLRYIEGPFLGMDSSTVSDAYAMSLLAVDYIVREYSTSYVRSILDALGEGNRGEAAFQSVLYITYEDIERGVKRRLERE